MSRAHVIITSMGVFAVGVVAGYVFMTRSETGQEIAAHIKQAAHNSHEQVRTMSEEVALKTAKVTRNPKITQDFVASQWESIGY